jgi:hypothetical protein
MQYIKTQYIKTQYIKTLKTIKKFLNKKNTIIILIIILLLIFIISICYKYFKKSSVKNKLLSEYVKNNIENKEKHMFPYRYFRDENENVLPIVAVSGFFRDEKAKQLYFDYINNGINVIGITAYKSFPRIMHNDDEFHIKDDFNYVKNIKNWLCCFKDPHHYGFTKNNNWVDISESDIYDVDTEPEVEKMYDFIYICNKDDDTCPKDGWNAINRNFKLAEACLPILINEYNLKGLIVGRVGCGLEKLYGDKVEITDFLEWNILQEKMRQSRFLFLPNIYDASPRVIAECITKGLPVLMNKSILCGFKYISYDTGEFFIDENNIKLSLDLLLDKIDKINPKKWWNENYGVRRATKKLRNFLYLYYPDVLENVKEVHFIL